MIEEYTQLNSEQMNNIFYLLDRTPTSHLDKLKLKYGVSGGGKGLKEYRNRILDNVMMHQIPFGEFIKWLADVDLEGNSSMFIYEPINLDVFEQAPLDKLFQTVKKKTIPLYEINKDKLKEISLVNVNKDIDKEQLILTFAAPSQVQYKDKENKETVLENHIYLAYFIIDYKCKNIVLLMHPTSNLLSICGETKKDWDDLTWILLRAFNHQIFSFKLQDPDWLLDALFLITEEYFHHHNPTIDAKMNEVTQKIVPQLLKKIQKVDSSFTKEDSYYRFERALIHMFESEFTTKYGRINIAAPFGVFLHQSDKGVTEFRANSRGKALNYADAGEIVKLMWDTGDIASLGIIYTHFDHNRMKKDHPYKVAKTDRYFSLKKYNTSSTKKEVIDDVLQIFNKYKQRVQSTSTTIENHRQGTDNAKT